MIDAVIGSVDQDPAGRQLLVEAERDKDIYSLNCPAITATVRATVTAMATATMSCVHEECRI